MPIQADPPFIDSAAAQAYRARLRAIYNAPSAIPAQRFNVQQPLPPVPYTNSPNFPAYLDAQIKANPTPQPPTRIAPPLPPPITPITPPPTTNPVPRIAPPSGGGAAATVVTTTAGGVITGAGVSTGGLALLAGGLLIYNARELYKLFKLSQPESKPISKTLRGGQDPNTNYLISGYITELCTPFNGEPPVEIGWRFDKAGPRNGFPGPITILRKVNPNEVYGGHSSTGTVLEFGSQKLRGAVSSDYSTIGGQYVNNFDIPTRSNAHVISIDLVAIPVGQNEPEPEPAKPQQKRSPIKSGITPSLTPQSISSPNPQGVRSPTSPPPVVSPLPTNNRIPYTITTPGANPITITAPGAAPVVITPTGTPATIKVTRPSQSPFLSPTPTAIPRTTPTGDPVTTPAGVPIAVSSPGSAPTNLVMPGTTPITITYPGQAPIVIDPTTSKPPSGVQAAPIPKPGAFITTPITPTQTPTNPVTTPTTPTTTPTTADKPFGIDISSLNGDAQKLGLLLVGISQLVKGVQTNTSTQALQAAAAAGTCSTTAPGGCSSNAMNNAVNAGNQNLLNKLGLGAQGVDLTLLGVINTKLGNQITGGLSGGLGRLSNFLGIDRVFNLINFMANLHNAFMLSNSLKITLLEMLSSVGNATGLLQTAEEENVDLNEVYNKGVRALINSVLGDEQAAKLEIQFRRANRIYQAAANSTNAVSSMISSLGNVVEVGAEYGGKIGNALKAAGAVNEKAYQWMAEKFDAKVSPFIKYSQTVEGVTTALETINEIAQSVVEGQQAATEFQKANTEFIKAVAEVKKDPGIENKAVAAEVAKQKENATKDPTGEDETGLLSFLTDL